MQNRGLQFLFDKLKSSDVTGPIRGRRDAEVQMAAAMLLYEAAMADGTVDASEKRKIIEALEQRFDMSTSEAAQTFRDTADKYDPEHSLGHAARTLTEQLEESERLQLMTLVERVVYSDGVLDADEAALLGGIRHVLSLPNAEIGHIRREVRKLMKLSKHKEAEGRDAKMNRAPQKKKQLTNEISAAGGAAFMLTMGGSRPDDDDD